MKIAFISSGSSVHVKKIANYLVNNGFNITLFTLPNHNKLLDDFDKKINIIKLPFSGKKGYYLNVRKLRKYLNKEKFDLVNCHYASGYGTLARLTKYHPLCLAVFGSDVYDFPYKSKFNMHQIIKNLNNADVITSTSHVMADKVHEFYKENKKIYITPFGVDINLFKPKKVKKENYFVFGTVKKMEYTYGIDILLKAYHEFRKNVKEAKTKLIIYGRGSKLNDFKDLSKKLKIDTEVEFKGFIENELVPDAFNKMDVACFPSRSESFGVAAIEAMACGTPIIASDAAGFTEVIENNQTGLLVPKDNISALAEAMKKMYYMKDIEREVMKNKEIKAVKDNYNFEKNMEKYIEVIRYAFKNRNDN